MSSLGTLYVLAVPYAAAISAIPELVTVAGFRGTGWIWVITFFLAPAVLLIQKNRVVFPLGLWLPWFGFVLLSLLWVPDHARYTLQDAGQIVTPLIVGIVASSVIRTEEQLAMLRRGFTHCLLFCLAVLVWRLVDSRLYAVRILSVSALFVGCVFAADITRAPRRSIVGWLCCFAIAGITGSRMVAAVLLAIWIIHPSYRRKATRVGALLMCVLIGVSLLLLPSFKDRFYEAEDRGVQVGDSGAVISGTGRFEAWPRIWQEAQKHVVFGAGVGSSSVFVPQVWPQAAMPHNDYLRIVFEFGWSGLTLFLSASLAQLWALRVRLKRTSDALNEAFAVCYMALAALLIISFSENTLIYGVWYMHPLFAYLGSAYGVEYRLRRPNPPVHPPCSGRRPRGLVAPATSSVDQSRVRI